MTDNHALYRHSLDTWQQSEIQGRGSVCVNWQQYELDELPWVETYSIDELPKDDLWNTSATEFKLWQEDLYQSWGHEKCCTKHFMAHEPQLAFDISPILAKISTPISQFVMNFMKVPPGRLIPWHCDTYGYAIKKFNVPQPHVIDIRRSIVFMNDWCFGQVAQFGRSMLCDWKAGDIYTWPHEAWHGLANFGNRDIVIMQITTYG